MPEKLTPEQERLIRLRERQLSSRDPLVKDRKKQQYFADRERRRDKSLSLGKMWKVIPHIWRGVMIGVALGLLIAFVLLLVWDSPWNFPCGGIAIIVLAAAGGIIGNGFDLRDEIKDLSSH